MEFVGHHQGSSNTILHGQNIRGCARHAGACEEPLKVAWPVVAWDKGLQVRLGQLGDDAVEWISCYDAGKHSHDHGGGLRNGTPIAGFIRALCHCDPTRRLEASVSPWLSSLYVWRQAKASHKTPQECLARCGQLEPKEQWMWSRYW